MSCLMWPTSFWPVGEWPLGEWPECVVVVNNDYCIYSVDTNLLSLVNNEVDLEGQIALDTDLIRDWSGSVDLIESGYHAINLLSTSQILADLIGTAQYYCDLVSTYSVSIDFVSAQVSLDDEVYIIDFTIDIISVPLMATDLISVYTTTVALCDNGCETCQLS